MIILPADLVASYTAHLQECGLPAATIHEYKKWLRYYLDFRHKYAVQGTEGFRLFLEKLDQKKQTAAQRQAASHAISLYLQMTQRRSGKDAPEKAAVVTKPVNEPRVSAYRDAGYQETSDSPEWDDLLAKLAGEIKVRHYSRKTLKTYALWSRQFQRFL